MKNTRRCPICGDGIASAAKKKKVESLKSKKELILKKKDDLVGSVINEKSIGMIKRAINRYSNGLCSDITWEIGGYNGGVGCFEFRDSSLSIHGSYGGSNEDLEGSVDVFRKKMDEFFSKELPNLSVVEISQEEKCWVSLYVRIK